MLKGEQPSERDARIFDVCLILHADHELNASTFTARVVAGTLADMYAAVTGGHWRAVRPAAWRRQHKCDEDAAGDWRTENTESLRKESAGGKAKDHGLWPRGL